MNKSISFFSPADEFARQLGILAQKSPDFATLAARLSTGELKPAPMQLYFTERANSVTDVLLTKEGKTQATGVRSLTGNALDKGYFFMPVKIQILAATGVTTDNDSDLLGATFGFIEDLNGAAANGDFSFESDSQVFMDKISMQSFATKDTNLEKGCYYLDYSFIMKELTKVKLRLESTPPVANAAYKCIMHGIGVRP